MEDIGKRSWNKDKKENPIVTDLPKNKDKFKDADVCKDVDILLYDDNDNPSFISIPCDKKEESDKNYRLLSKQHEELKSELEKINKDVKFKFGDRNTFNQKIDELNQETETLIDEIEKWPT